MTSEEDPLMTSEVKFDWHDLYVEVDEHSIRISRGCDMLLHVHKPGPYHCADHRHMNVLFVCRDDALGYESERRPFSVDIDLDEVANPSRGPA